MNTRISDYTLERLALGELSEEQSKTLFADPETAARAAALREDSKRILNEHPYPIRSAPASRPGRRFKAFAPAFAAAAAAVVIAFAVAAPRWTDRGDDFRIKGEASRLYLYKKTAGEAAELSDGAAARRGDAIQLGFSAAKPLYGFIFSVDGRGRLTAHFPESGATAVSLGDKFTLLDSSYILDDAPRYEVFILVSSSERFDLRRVEDAAARAAPDQDPVGALEKTLGKNFRVSAIRLRKE